MSEQPTHKKLALGTVQLGLRYGIREAEYKPPGELEANRIIGAAVAAGINLIDTAYEYGCSEEVLGRSGQMNKASKIVTKTPKLRGGTLFSSTSRLVQAAYRLSCEALGVSRCYGLMIHDAPNLSQPGGCHLAKALLDLRENGEVSRVGVSVYTPDDARRWYARYPFDLIQFPFSLADQRFLEDGTMDWLKERGVEIHVRSVFLQGLLLMEEEQIPNGLEGFRPTIAELKRRCQQFALPPEAACLRFGLSIPQIDHVVVGVNTSDQLREIIEWSPGSLPEGFDHSPLKLADPSLLDPSTWARKINI